MQTRMHSFIEYHLIYYLILQTYEIIWNELKMWKSFSKKMYLLSNSFFPYCIKKTSIHLQNQPHTLPCIIKCFICSECYSLFIPFIQSKLLEKNIKKVACDAWCIYLFVWWLQIFLTFWNLLLGHYLQHPQIKGPTYPHWKPMGGAQILI